MKIAIAFAAVAALALTVPALAQDQQALQAEHGMKGMEGTMKGGMDGNMMARMNKMMDQCEKMMGSGTHKGMRHRKKS